MECPRVTKIVKGIKFEGVWDKLESRKDTQRQSVTKTFETNSSFHAT